MAACLCEWDGSTHGVDSCHLVGLSSTHVFGPRTDHKEGRKTGMERGEVEERGVEKGSVKCGMLCV